MNLRYFGYTTVLALLLAGCAVGDGSLGPSGTLTFHFVAEPAESVYAAADGYEATLSSAVLHVGAASVFGLEGGEAGDAADGEYYCPGHPAPGCHCHGEEMHCPEGKAVSSVAQAAEEASEPDHSGCELSPTPEGAVRAAAFVHSFEADLLGGEIEFERAAAAPEGDYQQADLAFTPAGAGDMAGAVIRLVGTAAPAGDPAGAFDFDIALPGCAHGAAEIAVSLAEGGEAEVHLVLDLAHVLEHLPFAPLAEAAGDLGEVTLTPENFEARLADPEHYLEHLEDALAHAVRGAAEQEDEEE